MKEFPVPKHLASESTRREFLLLKERFFENSLISKDEAEKMFGWADGCLESLLGQHLIEFKCLDGNWLSFLEQSEIPFDQYLLKQAPSLIEMKKRHECVRAFLRNRSQIHASMGVFPASYADEWSPLSKDFFSCFGVREAGKISVNEQKLDVIIDGAFLYGNNACGADKYPYLFSLLKPGGVLITSSWCPSNKQNHPSLSQEELFFQMFLGLSKGFCCSPSEVKNLLISAGFESIQLISNPSDAFSTFVAKKRKEHDKPLKMKRGLTHAPRKMSKKPVFR